MLPWWYRDFDAGRGVVVKSGCPLVGCCVSCDPGDMARRAGVSLPVLAVARYIESEHGAGEHGTAMEKVLLAELAVNQGKRNGTRALDVLLYRVRGSAGYGTFGPAHGGYSRWASTSRDPCQDDLAIAEFVLSSKSNDFGRGADDQWGALYVKEGLTHLVNYAAKGGNYWIGHLPGVNPWHVTAFKHYGYAPDSPQGKQLIAQALAQISTSPKSFDWHYGMNDGVEGKPWGTAKIAIGLTALGFAGLWAWDRFSRRRTPAQRRLPRRPSSA